MDFWDDEPDRILMMRQQLREMKQTVTKVEEEPANEYLQSEHAPPESDNSK